MFKKIKPTTPGQRGRKIFVNQDLWKGGPEKKLIERKKSHAGRDNFGHISVRRRSAPFHKEMYRMVDFKRDMLDKEAVVIRLEYDPNRSAHIALIKYENGHLSYILAPEGLKKNDIVCSYSGQVPVKPGNCGQLKNIPIGTTVHSIEMIANQGGKLIRSAGSYAKLLGMNRDYAILRLRSGEVRMIKSNCKATVGVVSNKEHSNTKLGKAGRSRWMGIRPHVRGTAMNPVDHPHGGGEGKSRGRHPVSPTGMPTKGYKTRINKRGARLIVTDRRKSKRRK